MSAWIRSSASRTFSSRSQNKHMADGLPGFLDDGSREVLERDALRAFLLRQRWFGGKARDISSVRFRDWARIDTDAHPLYLTLVTVAYQDGPAEQYLIPLTVMRRVDTETIDGFRDAVLAPMPHRQDDLICDAVWSDDAMRSLMRVVWNSAELPSKSGRIIASGYRAADHGSAEPQAEVERLPAVHSNSALTLGGRYLLKLFRRVEPGINPDVEIGRFLARTNARVNTPELVGSIEYREKGSTTPATLALMQTLVPSRANAWEGTLKQLESFLERARQEHPPPTATRVRELVGGSAKAISVLGQRTAELHVALSAVPEEPDFAPEPASDAELTVLARQERQQAASVLDLLERRHDTLDEDARSLARWVLDRRTVLFERIDQLWSGIRPFVKIRVHGDYHLGQVLCVGDDFVIIDFEGEPARPLAERRAKQSPLRDIAGMLRSLSYAAHIGLRTAAAGDDSIRSQLAAWARGWEAWTSASFLEGYLDAAAAGAFMPAESEQFRRALELFMLDKALYELQYEMNNRPLWAAAPLSGVMQILESGAVT
jgi:trehalose synthase-fused probable maltokinase